MFMVICWHKYIVPDHRMRQRSLCGPGRCIEMTFDISPSSYLHHHHHHQYCGIDVYRPA
jgi:hypothetical protein